MNTKYKMAPCRLHHMRYLCLIASVTRRSLAWFYVAQSRLQIQLELGVPMLTHISWADIHHFSTSTRLRWLSKCNRLILHLECPLNHPAFGRQRTFQAFDSQNSTWISILPFRAANSVRTDFNPRCNQSRFDNQKHIVPFFYPETSLVVISFSAKDVIWNDLFLILKYHVSK